MWACVGAVVALVGRSRNAAKTHTTRHHASLKEDARQRERASGHNDIEHEQR